MVLRQFGHCHDVLFDQFGRHRTRVARNIVGSGQHDHCSRLQVDDIGIHANQHLRRSLPADSAIHIRLAGKVLVQSPEVRNRVAHEHDSLRICRLLLQVFVGLMIAAELVPVLKLICKATRAIEQAAVRARRIEVIRQLAFRAGGNQQKADGEKKTYIVALKNLSLQIVDRAEKNADRNISPTGILCQ